MTVARPRFEYWWGHPLILYIGVGGKAEITKNTLPGTRKVTSLMFWVNLILTLVYIAFEWCVLETSCVLHRDGETMMITYMMSL